MRLRYAVEPEPLDTAGAIRFAAREGGIDDTFIVVNGDVLTDLDVDALVKFHRDSGAEATIHLTPVEDPSMFGVVPTDDDGRVIAFIEKPPRDEAPTNRINAGTYVLEPSVLERIAGDRKVSIEREVFPGMAAEGRLYAMSTDDYWLDTGTPLQYLRANLDLLGGRVHQVEGIAPDAEIDASAVVEHSLVGPGSRVGAGVEVHDSVLMAGARVEEGAHIVRSVLGRGAAVGAGATLEGVVVGDEQVIEPGASVARRERPGARLMRALVTGGAGFIGSNLVDRLLAEGHSVDVVDNLATGKPAEPRRCAAIGRTRPHDPQPRHPRARARGTRRAAEARGDLPLAAQADVRVSVAEPMLRRRGQHPSAAVNVLEAARGGGKPQGRLRGEWRNDLRRRRSAATSRSRRAIRRCRSRPMGSRRRLSTTTSPRTASSTSSSSPPSPSRTCTAPVRIPHGEAGVVSIFAGRLLSGQPCTIFGTGDDTRDYVFVDDVVDAFVRAASRGGGLLVNIGSGRETSVNALYATMAPRPA